MPRDTGDGEARIRVLDAAEAVFARKGFAATTLRDVVSPLGMTHAALYYHFPGGKEEIFAAVMERNIRRHGKGLESSMKSMGPSIEGKLRGAARWLLSQAPMDLLRMKETDMPALPEATARRLMDLTFRELIVRIRTEIHSAVESGELEESTKAGLMAGAFLGLIESLHTIPDFAVESSRERLADELIRVLLKGLGYEGGEQT